MKYLDYRFFIFVKNEFKITEGTNHVGQRWQQMISDAQQKSQS